MYQQLINDFVSTELLPDTYAEDAVKFFLPLLKNIEKLLKQKKLESRNFVFDFPILGIQGGQGTGKSTVAALLTLLLRSKGIRVAQLSLDDFYLSKTDRLDLAKNVHPLLSSRGVPGTHNTQLMGETLNRLQQLGMGENLVLPSFDKSQDDLTEKAFLPEVEGPIDLIILEGWFVGLYPESESALQAPINDLEANEDPDCSWRIYVNQKLATEYQELFQHISLLVTLQAPDFKQIIHWRTLQEDKLKARSAENTDGIMDLLELKRFVQHFERLTRHGLATMPSTADITYQLDSNHRIIAGSIDPS